MIPYGGMCKGPVLRAGDSRNSKGGQARPEAPGPGHVELWEPPNNVRSYLTRMPGLKPSSLTAGQGPHDLNGCHSSNFPFIPLLQLPMPLLLQEHTRHVPTTGPLHLLLQLPEPLFLYQLHFSLPYMLQVPV